jgi:hypothetical protein
MRILIKINILKFIIKTYFQKLSLIIKEKLEKKKI